MNFPGSNTITLTDAALMQAVESAINAARREGEDYVHVTGISRKYSYSGDFDVTITTDVPKAEVVEIVPAQPGQAA